jgi:hypothetical protein
MIIALRKMSVNDFLKIKIKNLSHFFPIFMTFFYKYLYTQTRDIFILHNDFTLMKY